MVDNYIDEVSAIKRRSHLTLRLISVVLAVAGLAAEAFIVGPAP